MTETSSSLGSLGVFWDHGERSAAQQLALDEALLDAAEMPLLRFYQWHGAALTLGYFQRWEEMPPVANMATTSETEAASRPVDMARRWTGGGMVDHRGDCPYSLMVPAGHPLATLPAVESYRWIHQRLAQSIAESFGMAAVAEEAAGAIGRGGPAMACFDAPVAWDVVHRSSGEKIAGAAQRRSRGRLLHQGSVMIRERDCANEASVTHWRQAFAEALAPGKIEAWVPNDSVLKEAERLATERYATAEWLQRF